MARMILKVTHEPKDYQDQYAHALAAQISARLSNVEAIAIEAVNQFGLSPALIVIDYPDGAELPRTFEGVDLTGVEFDPS